MSPKRKNTSTTTPEHDLKAKEPGNTEHREGFESKRKRDQSLSPERNASAKRVDLSKSSYHSGHHLDYNDLPNSWSKSLPAKADAANAVKTGPSEDAISITYHKGDMFADAPENCVLIHACNTQGSWGAGIAKAFKDKYPRAFKAHHTFCVKDHNKTRPVPTASTQLLAPVDLDYKHWIGCLFTSAKYGRAKDKPAAILHNTFLSMQMLLELVKIVDEGGTDANISTIRMCKINSGMFGVPWEKTEAVLQSIVLQKGWRTEIEVWAP